MKNILYMNEDEIIEAWRNKEKVLVEADIIMWNLSESNKDGIKMDVVVDVRQTRSKLGLNTNVRSIQPTWR